MVTGKAQFDTTDLRDITILKAAGLKGSLQTEIRHLHRTYEYRVYAIHRSLRSYHGDFLRITKKRLKGKCDVLCTHT